MNINRIGESTLTESQKRKVRRLARTEALSAEQIASVLGLNLDLVEAELVQGDSSIDPQAIWQQQSRTPIPTSEDFQRLFETKDRDGLTLAALHLVRLENFRTPQYLKEDCEMFALRKAIEAIDELLSRNDSGSVRAYLNTVIKGALCDARTGRKVDARNSVSSATRKVRPKPKVTDKKRDALVAEMQNKGMSSQLIEAELDSLGLKPGPQLCKPVGQWPVDHLRSSDGHYSGESPLLEFGESPERSEWDHLKEILTEEEYQYLYLRAAGKTQGEIKDEFNVSIRQQQAIFQSAQAKVQSSGR